MGDCFILSTGRPGRRRLTTTATGLTERVLTRFDDFIRCTGDFTVDLPKAFSLLNHRYSIKNAGSGVVSVTAFKGEFIDTDMASIVLCPRDGVTIISDSIGWWII